MRTIFLVGNALGTLGGKVGACAGLCVGNVPKLGPCTATDTFCRIVRLESSFVRVDTLAHAAARRNAGPPGSDATADAGPRTAVLRCLRLSCWLPRRGASVARRSSLLVTHDQATQPLRDHPLMLASFHPRRGCAPSPDAQSN